GATARPATRRRCPRARRPRRARPRQEAEAAPHRAAAGSDGRLWRRARSQPAPQPGQRSLLLRGRHRRDQGPQADVDEVDVGDRERDVAHDDDTATEEPVDEIDQGDVAPGYRGGHASPPGTKLYGGHGPVSWIRAPSASWCPSSPDARAGSPATRSASTR